MLGSRPGLRTDGSARLRTTAAKGAGQRSSTASIRGCGAPRECCATRKHPCEKNFDTQRERRLQSLVDGIGARERHAATKSTKNRKRTQRRTSTPLTPLTPCE